MKTIKSFILAIIKYAIALLVYLIYVLDRVVMSITFNHLSNFATWAELHLPEDNRTQKNINRSFLRVCIVTACILVTKWILS
jgi:hypothetical protein